MFIFDYAALSHPGKVRENNEDNFYIDGQWRADVRQAVYGTHGTVADGYLLASVCDGIGGEDFGEVASLTAVEALHEWYGAAKEELLRENTSEYTEEANGRICDKIRASGRRLGTTFSALEFSGDTVFAVNLGDSRMYLFREGKLEQLSTDHTVLARMLSTGQITEEEAAVHPMRHRITQYFGIFPEEMVLEPAQIEKEIKQGDRYLLCSDGLTDMLPDKEIQNILGEEEAVEEAAQRLVQKAIDRGGKDNVTVIVIGTKQDDRKSSSGREKNRGKIRAFERLREFVRVHTGFAR